MLNGYKKQNFSYRGEVLSFLTAFFDYRAVFVKNNWRFFQVDDCFNWWFFQKFDDILQRSPECSDCLSWYIKQCSPKKIDAFFKLMSFNLMIFSKFWYKINCSTLITHNSFLTLSFRQQVFLNELEIIMASWKVESCLDGSVIWSWWFFRFKPNWNKNLMFLPKKSLHSPTPTLVFFRMSFW